MVVTENIDHLREVVHDLLGRAESVHEKHDPVCQHTTTLDITYYCLIMVVPDEYYRTNEHDDKCGSFGHSIITIVDNIDNVLNYCKDFNKETNVHVHDWKGTETAKPRIYTKKPNAVILILVIKILIIMWEVVYFCGNSQLIGIFYTYTTTC